jgi:hypothetical protein
MFRIRPHPLLFAAVLIAWSLPARAADPDRYLLDDANFVLSVDVRQVVQSPSFAKHFEKTLDELLKQEAVQAVLKDTGFNPVKDVDHLLIVFGTKSFPVGEAQPQEASNSSGPLIVVTGRFDPQKIQTRVAKYAEEMPEIIKIHGIGKADVAEVKMPGQVYFGVVVDKNTVALSPRREEIEDLLEKAAGDRKTELKNADLQRILKDRAPKQVVQLAATRDAVFGGSVSVKMENGKNIVTHKYMTLADYGLESIQGGITLSDKLEGKVALTAKDADSATKVAGQIEQGLGQAKAERAGAVNQFKDLAPVFDALDTIKVTTVGKGITLSGHGAPEAVLGFFKAMFVARAQPGLAPPAAADK